MLCIEQIASVSNVTDESKMRDLRLFSLCPFRVLSTASGRSYVDGHVRTLNQEFCTRTFAFHMLSKPISRHAHNTVLQVQECRQCSVSFKAVSQLLLEKGSVSIITMERVNRSKSITLKSQTSQLMASFCMQNFQHIPIHVERGGLKAPIYFRRRVFSAF